MENKPILSFEKVSIIYKKAPLLQNISFKVMAKENVCLLGKSGVGKSSLLNSVTNTKIVKSGLVYFDGVASNKKEYKKLKKQCSYLDQIPNLIDTDYVYEAILRSAKQKLTWLQKLICFEPKWIKDKILAILKEVNLNDYVSCIIKDLSAGQKQRVEIAKLFFKSPKLLLVDEPTTGLDPLTASKIMDLITDFVKREKITLVFVTHDIDLALKYSTRIIALKNHALVLDRLTEKLTKEQLYKIYDN
ncbi:ABC transporter ATP-binding protein [Mycoplasmoides genitalium]|uniref:Probable ABC transporter ATP-binding protein p29 n=2 Tax=Mycoplasmoides genitalium TaxID=2097 RepID=P29_MYCGE|nr:ABC transporter ATP-binding protein [Mycoplasmoides genitalium]P47532.1 RecName: Full=Probable ABC transporter ATP-binding protein p29 [Mycoplasmoides genitalium G37]AAC71511.1 phosphonate ABC transporter, ATP-binding protein, putative [Mycoplasmoides genitalium G37]ABY79551.1 phosphonate ABC transporter, ATP-binding protein, putative [synthetic Mycoplasma genitalium JCVI-1.0]AFQ04117.1 phosphonate ABC transporter ATP-binding protein [Mycoplasmoides genitalium M6320]